MDTSANGRGYGLELVDYRPWGEDLSGLCALSREELVKAADKILRAQLKEQLAAANKARNQRRWLKDK